LQQILLPFPMSQFKQFSFKKFGLLELQGSNADAAAGQRLDDFIKVIFLKKGAEIMVDFKDYRLEEDALFFVNGGQWYQMKDECCHGSMLYYNRDFYCVEIHDKEVACDGILFHNLYEIPVVNLSPEQSVVIEQLFKQIHSELIAEDSSLEEMLRILLKQIIIRSTRIWKNTHEVNTEESREELEFIRKFSQLVEWNFTTKHTVADYADLLNITPKLLNKRITKFSKDTPNDLIKQRIILEAQRLLAHTSLSVKEIGYKLGYEDPSYFIRLFSKQANASPQQFRKQYAAAE
jgi:AraC-like DNA-binding protein